METSMSDSSLVSCVSKITLYLILKKGSKAFVILCLKKSLKDY